MLPLHVVIIQECTPALHSRYILVAASMLCVVYLIGHVSQLPLFAEPLFSNGSCIVAYFAVVAYQRVYMPQY
jgi:hypothetical protein